MAAGLIISLETIRKTHPAEYIQKQMGQLCVSVSWIHMNHLIWPCFHLKPSCCWRKRDDSPSSNVYTECPWAGSYHVMRAGNGRGWRDEAHAQRLEVSALIRRERMMKMPIQIASAFPPPHKLPIFQSRAVSPLRFSSSPAAAAFS